MGGILFGQRPCFEMFISSTMEMRAASLLQHSLMTSTVLQRRLHLSKMTERKPDPVHHAGRKKNRRFHRVVNRQRRNDGREGVVKREKSSMKRSHVSQPKSIAVSAKRSDKASDDWLLDVDLYF